MRIPSKFHQFEDEKVLIVATGVYDADIYFASNGIFEKIKSIKIPRRKYTDDEGYSLSKSRVGIKKGGIVISGSVREYPKEAVMQEFLNQLRKELKAILNPPAGGKKVSYIYLFSPGYVMDTVRSVFPAVWKKKIKISIRGNFPKLSPAVLLQKIDLKIKKLI